MQPYLASDAKVVDAAEYLRHFPQRGSIRLASQVDLAFFHLTDCLCLGSGQAIAPLHGHSLPLLFRESVPYPANEVVLAQNAARCLGRSGAEGNGLRELEEAVALSPPGADNFWHWTTECLPKLLTMESLGYQGPYILPAESRVVRESLDMFGIAESRRIQSGPAWLVRKLILPQRLTGFELPENMALTAFLRDSILARTGILPGSRRCYVRRIGRRRIVNEERLLELLAEFGFETMTPEDHDLPGQWRYMTNCQCAIMAHGANTTLTLAQPHGSAFVEFFSNRYINYSSMHSIRLLRQHYLPLVEELDISWYPDRQTTVYEHLAGGIPADITVQLIHLRMHLETLCG